MSPISPHRPKRDRAETVYLHLAQGRYPADLIVRKMVKSPDSAVHPGDVVVKARISVPGDFFANIMPTLDIQIESPAPEEAPQAEARPVKPWPATSTPLPFHIGHKPVQHRDGKEPWCDECGRTAANTLPMSKLPPELDIAADDE